MTELTDEQVAAALRALQRPMYMFQMAGENTRPGADKTYRRALAEAREILQNPVEGAARARSQAVAQAREFVARARRPVNAGDTFHAPKFNQAIIVMRVARDGSWADIRVVDNNQRTWTKRQPLRADGWFPFGVQRTS